MGLAASIIGHDWLWCAIILSVRVAGDFAINVEAMIILKRKHLLLYNIPTVLFFTLLELILPFLIIDKKVLWKGQSFQG